MNSNPAEIITFKHVLDGIRIGKDLEKVLWRITAGLHAGKNLLSLEIVVFILLTTAKLSALTRAKKINSSLRIAKQSTKPGAQIWRSKVVE